MSSIIDEIASRPVPLGSRLEALLDALELRGHDVTIFRDELRELMNQPPPEPTSFFR